MMIIREGISLKSYNTFGIDARADFFVELSSTEEIIRFINEKLPHFQNFIILGGGSNVLFVKDYHGLIMHMNNRGISVISKDKDHIMIRASAGENWDDLVGYCVRHNYGGLENLSMIPGSVGASPIQNIGAYGVELKDHFRELEAADLHDGTSRVFSLAECEFGYRDSIFKRKARGRYLILNIILELDKRPLVQTGYGAIREQLDGMHVGKPGIKDIREAVCRIRRSKLPDPGMLGNAGSFFKNPTVSNEHHERLLKAFPGIIAFPQGDSQHKLAAGWLIEKAGWKGYRKGDAGVHDKQALVLVNYGKASGQEILDLSEEIRQSVKKIFGVELEREINVI